MKASIACFVSAVSKFKVKKFKGSISLLITGDEEGVAIDGTKRVIETMYKAIAKIQSSLDLKSKIDSMRPLKSITGK